MFLSKQKKQYHTYRKCVQSKGTHHNISLKHAWKADFRTWTTKGTAFSTKHMCAHGLGVHIDMHDRWCWRRAIVSMMAMSIMNVVFCSSLYYQVNMWLLVCNSKPKEVFAPVYKHVSFIHGLVLSFLPHLLIGCNEKSCFLCSTKLGQLIVMPCLLRIHLPAV